uniref:Protein AMBP n=2 Tax=Canis lupus familiaris TaxID=9615 RepID=A0A8C0QEI9_CANLF
MWSLGAPFLLLTACLAARASPVLTPPDDIQVQENFDVSRIYGKWFHVAVGSTCPWLKKFMDRMSMSTLVLGEGPTDRELSMTSTRWRRGTCEEISGTYEKTGTSGKFLYHKPKWNLTMESYVVHTNYDEYAIFLTKKFSRHHGPTITAKLYGRQPQLRESLLEEFREVALGVGIPEDAIFTMADKGECVPGEQEPEPSPYMRARRAVLPQEEEGSGAGQLVNTVYKKEDACQLDHAEGPCLGMVTRYFYNGSSMACETFQYGGCLGNGNNFASEKECLQTCRTVGERRPLASAPQTPGPRRRRRGGSPGPASRVTGTARSDAGVPGEGLLVPGPSSGPGGAPGCPAEPGPPGLRAADAPPAPQRPAASPSSPAPAECTTASGPTTPSRAGASASCTGAAKATATSSTRRRSARSTAGPRAPGTRSCCANPEDLSTGHSGAGVQAGAPPRARPRAHPVPVPVPTPVPHGRPGRATPVQNKNPTEAPEIPSLDCSPSWRVSRGSGSGRG